MNGVYKVAKIATVIVENKSTKTLTLETRPTRRGGLSATTVDELCCNSSIQSRSSAIQNPVPETAIPGQFIMVWLPGIGEKPFSLSGNAPLAITVAGVGEFSKKLISLKKGDHVHYRGPFGKGFELRGKYSRTFLLVGGGYGAAPLRFLAKMALAKKAKVTMIVGARNKSLLQKTKVKGAELLVATDDGSQGTKGFVTDVMANLLKEGRRFDCVYACGPEIMMKKIAETCKKNKIPGQFLLERIFKCGIGVCGQCAIDDKLVCFDGPKFERDEVLAFKEFCKCQYDSSGKKISLRHH